jgi:glycosyltransferase involved in cell wall biosynthesis
VVVRLAVEVTTCTPARAGIGYYTEHLVDALLETRGAGDELVLLSNRPPAPALAERWAPHLRVEGMGLRALWMQVEAPRLLAECGADFAAFPNYVVPLASPCPTLAVVHDVALLRMPELFTLRKRLVMQPMLRQSLSAASVVATVSEASRADIVQWLGVPADRIALLPGAAHPSCRPMAPEEVAPIREAHGLRRPYVLTVGTLEPRKNLVTLLDAFDRLWGADKDPSLLPPSMSGDVDLVVVGGRGWRDRRLMRELGARSSLGRVRWLGYVPEDELIALYGGAELLVYPSRLEGFGLPVIEAMACGTPVVASDVTALREVAGGAAALVPPGDAPALAAAMARVLADPAAAAAAREAGLRRAGAFSWTRTAARLWELAHERGSTRVRAAHRANGAAVASAAASAPAPDPTPAPPPIGAPPPGLREAEWGVLAAVAYADLFDAPLPVEDAVASCMGATVDERELPRLSVSPALAPHLALHEGGYLALSGREWLVSRRLEGATKTVALVDRHRRTLEALASLPFVRMLAFSGGTAHKNPGSKPDIDLFVITAGGRAYTAYTLLFAAAKLTRTRGIVCPNYLIDENELPIAYHHDLFTAHQLISARPISGLDTYLAFCRANDAWVRPLFPGFQPRVGGESLGWTSLRMLGESVLAPVAPPVERLLRWGWRFHLRRRAARARTGDVVLADGILKLHLSDYRRRVLDRFGARLAALRGRLARAGAASDDVADVAGAGMP